MHFRTEENNNYNSNKESYTKSNMRFNATAHASLPTSEQHPFFLAMVVAPLQAKFSKIYSCRY